MSIGVIIYVGPQALYLSTYQCNYLCRSTDCIYLPISVIIYVGQQALYLSAYQCNYLTICFSIHLPVLQHFAPVDV